MNKVAKNYHVSSIMTGTIKGVKYSAPFYIATSESGEVIVDVECDDPEIKTRVLDRVLKKFSHLIEALQFEYENQNQLTIDCDVKTGIESDTKIENDTEIENDLKNKIDEKNENGTINENVDKIDIVADLIKLKEQNEALMKKVQELESRPKGGRKKIGVTRKLSLTLPQEDWDFLDRDAADHKQFADYLRSIVQTWISMRGRK